MASDPTGRLKSALIGRSCCAARSRSPSASRSGRDGTKIVPGISGTAPCPAIPYSPCGDRGMMGGAFAELEVVNAADDADRRPRDAGAPIPSTVRDPATLDDGVDRDAASRWSPAVDAGAATRIILNPTRLSNWRRAVAARVPRRRTAASRAESASSPGIVAGRRAGSAPCSHSKATMR